MVTFREAYDATRKALSKKKKKEEEMRGELALGGFAIASITFLEYIALQNGFDGIALSASVGAISAIVSAVATRRWCQRGKK
jgi:hypothetical protein